MNEDTKKRVIEKLLVERNIDNRETVDSRYPDRNIPNGAQVTRFCPSPTGFVHIGAIFTAQICQYVARQTDGVYILRIEDTDKNREVEGAKELIPKMLKEFDVEADEGLQADGSSRGDYGPYVQSERGDIYLAYAVDLIEKGRAYPCFATPEELQNAVEDQQSKKLRPGYYGKWAIWRDRSDEDVAKALDEDKSFVLRFRSNGSHEKRIMIKDRLKGEMSLPENDLDVPLIKSDEHRLPTYHLAHVVDDYLMKATIIFRGEEWLPSTPLHIELALALGIEPFKYAHTSVISILNPKGGGKRKLSKRKDPEADVVFWLKAAYPLNSIKAYLLGLANSNFEDWYKENRDTDLSEYPFSVDKLASSRNPLLDIKKLEDYAKDDIASMTQEHFNKQILKWSDLHDHELFKAMMADPDQTKKVLAIERDGEKPRKDVAKWSDAPEQFGYFYNEIFVKRFFTNIEEELSDLSDEIVNDSLTNFLSNYDHSADKEKWFENMKKSAEESGYSLDRKELKANPENYHGGLADYVKIIRLHTTGKTRTPDLYTIMQILGEDEVKNRLSTT